MNKCDLCKDDAEYLLCQFHMNECVIGERDLKAELDAARKSFAAWKASAKRWKRRWKILYQEVLHLCIRNSELNSRAKAAEKRADNFQAGYTQATKEIFEEREKRVQELESAYSESIDKNIRAVYRIAELEEVIRETEINIRNIGNDLSTDGYVKRNAFNEADKLRKALNKEKAK